MIAELTALLDLAKRLIALVKDVSEALPNGAEKQDVEKQLDAAKRDLELTESSTAKDLGYELCQCTFPPKIMLFTGNKNIFKCPACGNKVDKSREYAGINK